MDILQYRSNLALKTAQKCTKKYALRDPKIEKMGKIPRPLPVWGGALPRIPHHHILGASVLVPSALDCMYGPQIQILNPPMD